MDKENKNDCSSCKHLHTIDGKQKACIKGNYITFLSKSEITTTHCAGWQPKK